MKASGVLQGLAHAVEAARAPVLPHHRPDRPRQGEHPAERDRRHPVDDRRGRDGLVAEARDDAREEGVRGRGRDVGQDRRHGDGEEGPRVGQSVAKTRPGQQVVDANHVAVG